MKIFFAITVLLSLAIAGYGQKRWAFVTQNIDGIEKTGIIEGTGKVLVPIKYDRVFRDNNIFFLQNNKLWGCCNKTGKVLIPLIYEDIGIKVGEGLVRVKKNGKWGFVDINNNIVIDFKYDFACNFSKGKAYTIIGHSSGSIDKRGNKISSSSKIQDYCPEDLDTTVELKNQFEDSLLGIVKGKGKFGVSEKISGKKIIPMIYDEIGDYYYGTILVKKNNRWGAYFDTGKLITEPKYKSIGIFWTE